MPRAGVSYDEVAKAANQLLYQGQHPSVQRVREITGTGSNTTINRHLDTWRESFSDKQKAVLPGSVPEDLMSPLDEFWSTALSRAEANYLQYKIELEQKVSISEQQSQEVNAQLQAQVDKYTALEGRFEELERKYKNLKTENTRLAGQNETYDQTVSTIRSDYDKSLKEFAEIRTSYENQLDAQQVEFRQQRTADQERFDATEARMLKEIDQLRLTIVEQQYKENSLNESIKETKLTSQVEVFELQKQNQILKSQLSKSESDIQLR